ncbi:unnamed protein product [Caretta caretta]
MQQLQSREGGVMDLEAEEKDLGKCQTELSGSAEISDQGPDLNRVLQVLADCPWNSTARTCFGEEPLDFCVTGWDLERVGVDDTSMGEGRRDPEVVAMAHRREDEGDLSRLAGEEGAGGGDCDKRVVTWKVERY